MKPIILVLPYPPSANRLWATRVVAPKGKRPMAITYVTAEGVKFKDDVAALAREAGVLAPIEGRIAVQVLMYPARPQDWQNRIRKLGPTWDDGVRSIDLDNAMKATLDALKGIVFTDDGWPIRELHSKRMEPDHLGARLVVRVMPIPVVETQTEMEV